MTKAELITEFNEKVRVFEADIKTLNEKITGYKRDIYKKSESIEGLEKVNQRLDLENERLKKEVSRLALMAGRANGLQAQHAMEMAAKATDVKVAQTILRYSEDLGCFSGSYLEEQMIAKKTPGYLRGFGRE